jgi:pyruvate kinase
MTDANHVVPGDALRRELLDLTKAVEDELTLQRPRIDAALEQHRSSAINLACYLGLRKRDVHRLQLELAAVGLSSLGRCEGHVRDALRRLYAWVSGDYRGAMASGPANDLDWSSAEALLHKNTRALFGPRPADRHVYIMVTAPAAAQADAQWADDLLTAGANLLRINAAHETPPEWKAIATVFKNRAASLGRKVRVIVDLPGPKLRTEIRQEEPSVLHFPRAKDRLGRTLAPRQVPLVAHYEAGAQIPIPASWLTRLEAGDKIIFTDAGGRDRELLVRTGANEQVCAECSRSLYITAGLPIVWMRGETEMDRDAVGMLPQRPRELRMAATDVFLLNETGYSADPAVNALAFPEPHLLQQVKAGERVVLDDGKLFAIAESASPEGLLCRVQRVVKSPARLRSGKGIAFPDSQLSLGHLSERDETALRLALEHADGVGVSFVAAPQDVALVGERIRQAGKPGFGMILKLETRSAMNNLAAILFEALKYDPVGLMIARGDLAVELSFERLAEMQEEILWFGEACHLPVIWATQVLDNVAHSGLPTRAEVTDAAMSMRAECVMLNKGPHIATATKMLADIIRKMEAHQYKKRSLYRQLAVAGPPT